MVRLARPYVDNSIPGWMSPAELQWLYKKAKDMQTIVELGSWEGRSTHALVEACKKGKVFAIDTWEPRLMKDFGDSKKAKENFYKVFRSYKNLNILEIPFDKAVGMFMDKSVDMTFIDAVHTYEVTKQLILDWLPKTTKVICGHDFSINYPGVEQAVVETFGGIHKLCEAIWYVELGV